MRLSACVLAASISALALGHAAEAQPKPPNIVVIVADDMGYADIGVHGSKDIPTPNVDALAASGIRFTDGYVSGPYCSPTRAGLLTGRYPQRFGHEFNIGLNAAHSEAGLPLSEKTMADRLKASGYRTALFGKWHLGSARRFFPTERGFDEFFGFLAGAHSYMGLGARNNPIYDGNERATSTTYLTDTLAGRAVEFITRNKERPFFLYLAFNAVHAPLQASDKYLTRFTNITSEPRRTYAAMLSAMDDGIGKALAALRQQGLEENTLIFFFSDNGGPITLGGTNGSSNEPLRGQKTTTWEGGIRVPFIISWKGRLPAGRTDSRPIIQLDVLPTALAAAGVDVQADWKLDGVNLLPFLTGTATGSPHEALYWRLGGNMSVRKGEWKLVKSYDGGSGDDPDKQTLDGAQLFNLTNDMSEKNNLARERQDKVKELADTWQAWRAQLVRPAWEPPNAYRGARRGCIEPEDTQPMRFYAGTWRGTFGAVRVWTWVLRPDSAGTITFARDSVSVPTRMTFVSSDSAVVDLMRPIEGAQRGDSAMLRLTVSVCGDDLVGTGYMRRRDGTGQGFPFNASKSPQ